jgi:galactose-1-phosphate uridylyltransferase
MIIGSGGTMGKIEFERIGSSVSILNPRKAFSEDYLQVEVRRDPLLGDTSVYNPFMKEKAKAFFGVTDEHLIEEMVSESRNTCLFCGDNFEKTTPRYPYDVMPEGRAKVGEAVLFPNLYPVGRYHAIVILCKEHFLRPSQFAPDLLANGYGAAQGLVRAAYAKDPQSAYVAINTNYLFPAGASLVHPHLQMLITPIAYSYHARLIEAGSRYYDGNASCYFLDLIETEKGIGARYVAATGRWHWLTSFSPIGSNEVVAIHEEESDCAELTGRDLRELAEGVSRVLSFYESLGHLSFNYTLYSVRKANRVPGFRLMLKVITRQNLTSQYRNDDYYLQKLLQSEVIINLPEELAEGLRAYF